EDRSLVGLVRELGAKKWVLIAGRLGSRTGKQCRERYISDVDKSPFSSEEEGLILRLYSQMGSKWAEMSKLLPGRPDNAIKNHSNTTMLRRKRKLKVYSSPTLPNPSEGVAKDTLPPFRASSSHKDASLDSSPLGFGVVEQQLYSLAYDTSGSYRSPKSAESTIAPLRFDTMMTGRIITPPQTPESFELIITGSSVEPSQPFPTSKCFLTIALSLHRLTARECQVYKRLGVVPSDFQI
ncbi:hypothetical protein K7432_017270, partial [Basidiobolus ranarum]